jgi:hypothetical protein
MRASEEYLRSTIVSFGRIPNDLPAYLALVPNSIGCAAWVLRVRATVHSILGTFYELGASAIICTLRRSLTVLVAEA